jgi:ribosomal protein S18 acetylase RimI-like enzyme
VEELSLKRGIKMIWLTVNKNNSPSLAWYLRMGFANAGPTIQDIGEGYIMDDFRLEKGLP